MFRNLLLFLLLGAGLHLSANNIEVSDIVLYNQDVAGGTTTVQFDLSWENSWRVSVGPANYDAAWVFAKYRIGGGPWQHATLSGTGAGVPGAMIDVEDNLGAFVYRATDGSGFSDFQDVELIWDYNADGVDPNAVVDVQVFAIEMVFVPEGAFQVGTGPTVPEGSTDELFEFYGQRTIFGNFTIRTPYTISDENELRVANVVGSIYYDGEGDQLGPVPAAFPKGFASFYCMKYEVSQSQFVAFFNTLTNTQKLFHDITGEGAKNSDEVFFRNGISWNNSGNATTSFPDVACSYVSADNQLAYMDWAGLRPYTELEYEKACRGTLTPIAGEYAWGNANVFNQNYNLSNTGQPNESVTNAGTGVGNMAYSSTDGLIDGPLRCGIFAASATNPTREETGGSYYGIMELSGNLYERTIGVGTPGMRAFDGSHGDGTLNATGAANVSGWPAATERVCFRGASWINSPDRTRVSDRANADDSILAGNQRLGMRGVRTAN